MVSLAAAVKVCSFHGPSTTDQIDTGSARLLAGLGATANQRRSPAAHPPDGLVWQ